MSGAGTLVSSGHPAHPVSFSLALETLRGAIEGTQGSSDGTTDRTKSGLGQFLIEATHPWRHFSQKQVSTNLCSLPLGQDADPGNFMATKSNMDSWLNVEGKHKIPGTENSKPKGKYAMLSGRFPQFSDLFFLLFFSVGQFSGSSKVLLQRWKLPSCTNQKANNPRTPVALQSSTRESHLQDHFPFN